MYSMFQQGYSLKVIALETGYNAETITKRLKAGAIERVNKKVSHPMSKYQYLLEEPMCEGRYYREYFK